MEPLASFSNYFWMFGAAVISGAIGGVGFELMQTRLKNDTGAVETPHRLAGGIFFDLGFVSSMLLGAITAVAVLYIFPPEVRITMPDQRGQSVVTLYYDLVKLIAFSLIVGSAGPSFLSAIQARAATSLNEQKMADVTNTAQAQVDHIAQATQTDVQEIHADARRQVKDVLDKLPQLVSSQMQQAVVTTNGGSRSVLEADHVLASNYLAGTIQDTVASIDEICNAAETKLQDRLSRNVDVAKRTLDAATASVRPEKSSR